LSRSCVLLLCLLVGGLLLGQPQPPEEKSEKDEGEGPYFIVKAGQRVRYEAIFEFIKKITGKEIIVSRTVMADRTKEIQFATSFKASYAVLRAVLEVNGMVLQDQVLADGTKVIKVLSDREVRNAAQAPPQKVVEDVEKETVPGENELVTAVIRLKYADPSQVQRILITQLMSRMGPGTAISVQGQPVVIIRHFAQQVKYYLKLIKALDVEPKRLRLYIYKLRNAVASEVANYLSQLGRAQLPITPRGMRTTQPTGLEATFVADERTNKLIILTYPENYPDIERVIRELDEEIPEGRGTIHIYQLKNVDAEQLATSLQSILMGQQQRQQQRRRPGQPQQLQPIPTRIVADKQTNSLIIEAEKERYEELKKIIEKLDVRRPQVLIEAAIIEVSADSTTNLGIELATVDLAGVGYRGAGGTLFGLSEIDTETLTKTPVGGLGLTALIYKDSFDRLPFLMQMLRSTSDVNVLSTPRLLTNDNEKGLIKVSDQVAIITTIDTATQQSRTAFGGYQEAGITLEITPHISPDKYLRLEVNLTIESFTAQPVAGSAAPPPKTTRQIQGIVTVPDRQLVIIGGLTSEKQDETVNKVPILGDIPIFGTLFRSTSVMKRRTNLYIFITPHILDDENFDTLREISQIQLRKAELEGGKTEGVGELLPEKTYERYRQRYESLPYLEMRRALDELFGRDFRRVRVEK